MSRVVIFTDGACSGNPGPGGYGAILVAEGRRMEIKGGEALTTNNRMELMAAIMALEGLKRPCAVELHTDSQYVRLGVTQWLANWKRNGWRTASRQPVKNDDLWKRLDEAASRHQVDWRWVKGHSGHTENERADELAREGLTEARPMAGRASGGARSAVTGERFTERLAAGARAVDEALDAILAGEARGDDAWPERLRDAMRHAVLGGGKRLRPLLLIETARLLGRADRGPLLAGCALELVHCYSLVHDDLPAMDDDDLRRGRPTVHKAFDEAVAILAGDALLTLAFEVMVDPRIDPDPEIRVALVASLARAAGAAGMAGGQALDLAAERRSGDDQPPLPEAGIRRLQRMKTGALLAFAVTAGARLGRASPDASARLAKFGESLGAAFQIGDDILDVEATTATLGKTTNKDAARGKATLVGALGLEGAKRERDLLARHAVDALSGFDGEADVLRAAALFTVERRS